MDFARKILNKYGWKEGEGLGKHNDGIVKPLKASMKFDNCGLGSDQAASDFNNHWWERVFNEASGNVEVKSGKNGVSMDLKNKDDSVEISTKGYSVKKLKKAKESRSASDSRYDNFLQSATLTKSGDEIENPNKIAVADISVTQYKALTDDELFRACGGRTAHKGARHGLKLSGKLSRIEQQEKELLARMQEKLKKPSSEKVKHEVKTTKDVNISNEPKITKPKKDKGRKRKSAANNISIENKPKDYQSSSEDTSKTKKMKTSKKSDKHPILIDSPQQKKKKSKAETGHEEPTESISKSKKKSKNRHKEISEI